MSVTDFGMSRTSGDWKLHRGLLLDEARPDVRRHDHDGVLEVDPVTQAVGQLTVLEHLQQNIEEIRMRFLDLIEQQPREYAWRSTFSVS